MNERTKGVVRLRRTLDEEQVTGSGHYSRFAARDPVGRGLREFRGDHAIELAAQGEERHADFG